MAPERTQSETIQARQQRLSRVPRACAACKIRKTRCDRANPCSNCLVAGIACQTPSKPHDNQAKPDIISQISKLVENLEKRVARIEHQGDAERSQFEQRSPHITPEAPRAEQIKPASDPTATETPYQGFSSFDRLSNQAVAVAQQAASLEGDDDELGIGATIDSLQTILGREEMSPIEYRFSRNSATRHIPVIVPLPANFVVAVVQHTKRQLPIFLYSYAINDPLLVEDLCRQVYFPTNAISVGHVTAMHGVLYFLLREHILLATELSQKFNLKGLLDRCEKNLNSGLETYDVFAMPSFENLVALVMGMIKAQEETKPLLCLTLISVATSQCQRLGYHREATYKKESKNKQEHMRRLFWTIYIFDKNMALLQGHSSNIQDFEIDAQYPTPSQNAATRPWDESFVVAIKLAKIQGQIYDRLYSPAVLELGYEIRKEHVSTLDATMAELRTELDQIDPGQVSHGHIFAMSRSHWDVMYYSTLTILRRGDSTFVDTMQISSQCFHAARMCLQSHIQCFSAYQKSGLVEDNDYAHWVLHCSSFTPFIIMFLHAVAGTSMDDVEILDHIVQILQRVRVSSKMSEKLYRVCSTFAKLARQLVEARNSCVGAYDVQKDSLNLGTRLHDSAFIGEEAIQNVVGESLANFLPGWESQEMSALLADWVSGQPSGLGTFLY